MSKKITIELPADYVFTSKVNGKPIAYHPEKMDQSWVIAFLEKGMQRFANDKFSGESPDTKYDLCMEIAKQANSGEAMPQTVRGSSKPKLPDNVALALRNAKADLTLMFKKLTGAAKIAEMVEHDTVKQFFEAKGDSQVWRDDVVQKWIEKQAESGKRDYVAEATQSLAIKVEDFDLDI